ncbi:MAG: hypothetical protein LBL26_06185 [Peptococcaceae bacterium]|jgi:hypothetical protein|nr:hypothetical protein [Peptococcaceae bacterium]
MPVYKNGNDKSVSYSGETWRPGETKEVAFFAPPEMGFEELSEHPRVRQPSLSSGEASLGQGGVLRIQIGDCNTFIVSVICKSGSVTVRESYIDSEVAVPVDVTGRYEITGRRTQVESLYVSCDSEGGAAVTYLVSTLS